MGIMMLRFSDGLAALAVSAIVLSGCAMPTGGSGTQAGSNSCNVLGPKALVGIGGGALIGAGTGALVAKNKAAGALIGGLLGAVAGGAIGKTLDNRDCAAAQLALRQLDTTPTGRQIAWADPDTGTHGTFTPTADATISNGRTCRPVQRDITFKDGTQTGGDTGIVCRNANGDYETMS